MEHLLSLQVIVMSGEWMGTIPIILEPGIFFPLLLQNSNTLQLNINLKYKYDYAPPLLKTI